MKRATFIIVFLSIMAGCGGGANQLETAPVTGKVLFKGKPLTGGTIMFHPKKEGNPATGEIRSDGSYTLTTYRAHDGAVLGEHVVTILPAGAEGAPPPLPGAEAEQSGIPERYTDAKTSPLRAEVKPGENIKDFPLEK